MTTGEPVFCSLWRSGAVFSQSEAEGDRKYTSVRLKKEGKKSGKEKAEKEEREKISLVGEADSMFPLF